MLPTPRFRFRPTLQRLDDRITPALSFATNSFAVGGNPAGVAVADFNGDGRPDIAVVNSSANTVQVLLNRTSERSGTPAFDAAVSFAVGTEPFAVAAGDVNGDGKPDLVVVNNTSKTVSVLANTTAGGALTFAAPVILATEVNPVSVVLADFNADGQLDIAVACFPNTSTEKLQVFRNASFFNGTTPAFAPPQLALDYNNPFAVFGPLPLFTGDFNGDGRPDLTANLPTVSGRIFFTQTNHYDYLLNTTPVGSDTFTFSIKEPTLTADEIAVGDFNADGVVSGFPIREATAAADFDGDGRTDAVVALTNSVAVRPNTTPTFTLTPSFGASQMFATGTTPRGLAVGDFNSDGRPDLVSGNADDGTVSVLLNTALGGTVTTPSLVGQFGLNGVWRYNRATTGWDQLTAANATALATAPTGSVVASFGGNGVWYFNPALGWYPINGYAASALAMDDLGNVYASFPDFGTAVYHLATGWESLTSVPATVLASNGGGTLAASFASYGTFKYTGAEGWKGLTGVPAAALDVAANGDVYAAFPGHGLNYYQVPVTWRSLNAADATAVAVDGRNQMAVNFPGYGLYHGPEVRIPIVLADSLAVDFFGNLTVALNGYGVWEYSATFGWRQRTTSHASFLALG